jgi:hypothetical protein
MLYVEWTEVALWAPVSSPSTHKGTGVHAMTSCAGVALKGTLVMYKGTTPSRATRSKRSSSNTRATTGAGKPGQSASAEKQLVPRLRHHPRSVGISTGDTR